jgi:hypothetical protein
MCLGDEIFNEDWMILMYLILRFLNYMPIREYRTLILQNKFKLYIYCKNISTVFLCKQLI